MVIKRGAEENRERERELRSMRIAREEVGELGRAGSMGREKRSEVCL